MKFQLTSLTLDDWSEIAKIANEKNLTFSDAMEEYAKKYPDKIKDLGILQENGHIRQSNISLEGVETKEVTLESIIEDLTNDS